MVEAPEKIWARFREHQPIVATENHIHEAVQYLRSDIAERQIAELRAERDEFAVTVVNLAGQRDAAEAENARLKALPLKDERHLTPDEQKTFNDALRKSGTIRQVLPLKDEVERVLEPFAALGEWEHLPGTDMPDEFEPFLTRHYKTVPITIGHLRAARALLSRLRAGEQEEWRTLSSLPEKGLVIVGCYNGKGQWCAEVANVDYVREHLSEIVSGVFSTSPHLAFDYTHWMPLPAAPSNQGGDRG